MGAPRLSGGSTDGARKLFFAALEYHNQGRLPEAETLYRQACELVPDRPSVLANLAAVLVQQGKAAEAERYCHRALAVAPDDVDTLVNLGWCLRERGASRDALSPLEKALAVRPDDAEIHNNLGLLRRDLGDPAGALRHFERGLALSGDAPGLLANRGGVLAWLGRLDEACDCYRRALAVDPGFSAAQEGFFDLVTGYGYRPLTPDAGFIELAVRAMREPWGRPHSLAPLLVQFVDTDPAVLPTLLAHAPVPDAVLERRLTALRAELAGDEGTALELQCALAHQCFINEYLYDTSPDETRRVATLTATVTEALDEGREVDAHALITLATYTPLHRVEGAERLLERAWPGAVDALVRQQVQEPLEEREFQLRIRRLTPVADVVSKAVREQYEENPYPRWTAAARPSARRALEAYMQLRLPGARFRRLGLRTPVRILNAGCGTGQSPIETAQRVADSEVLAVDLSLASLAYAARMASSLGLTDIRFAQADILELDGSDFEFDFIESTGVLHHMADPAAGLRVLASLLAEHGVMRLALYSEAARRPLAPARRLVERNGLVPDIEGIRTLRRLLMEGGDPVTGWPDFYTMSECRDLLFHVQEHRFTLPELATMLADSELEFIGFELEPRERAAFTAVHPDPAALHELDTWTAFEADHPDTFTGMYQFWVQKGRA